METHPNFHPFLIRNSRHFHPFSWNSDIPFSHHNKIHAILHSIFCNWTWFHTTASWNSGNSWNSWSSSSHNRHEWPFVIFSTPSNLVPPFSSSARYSPWCTHFLLNQVGVVLLVLCGNLFCTTFVNIGTLFSLFQHCDLFVTSSSSCISFGVSASLLWHTNQSWPGCALD